MGATIAVAVSVNGVQYERNVEPRLLLSDFIRQDLGLTGTHVGCDTSNCGACTVHMDGEAVKSCTVLAVQADGAEITTIEGLGTEDNLHPMQEAFWNNHGLQCGYCTPGMIMSASALLTRNPHPTEDEVRHGLEGSQDQSCQDAGRQHGARRNAVPGRAHEQIGELGPPQHSSDDALDQRGPSHGDADHPLEQPFAGKLAPSGARVLPQAGSRRQRIENRRRRELGTAQCAVDPLAGERIEEVGRIADEQCTTPAGNRAA